MNPRAGDLIAYVVTPQSPWTSKAVAVMQIIRGLGKGDVIYSHVAAWAADRDQQYEQVWPRAGLNPIDFSRAFEVWRIGDPSPAQTALAVRWWKAHLDDRYNMIGLLTGGLLGLPHEEVCSQYYADGWHAAGVHFQAEGARIVAPNVLVDHEGARRIALYMPKVGRVI